MAERRIIEILTIFKSNVKNIAKNVKGFNQVLNQNMEGFRKQNKANTSMINTGAKLGNNFRKLTHGMRGFRMEMLGVMFFGMGLQRFFSGLIKPAMQLTGIFELWGTILAIFFLPTAMFLLQNVLLPLMDIMLGISEGTRFAMGAFVLFGVAMGGLLFLVGMLTLGLGSLAIAWGFITAVVLPILGVITAVSVAIVLLIGYWTRWTSISDEWKLAIKLLVLAIAGIALALGAPFIATLAAVTAAVMLVIDVIKNWEDIITGFKSMWEWVFDALPQPVQDAWNKIKSILDMIKEALNNIGGKTLRILASIAVPTLAPFLMGDMSRPTDKSGTDFISPSDIRVAVEEGTEAAFNRVLFKSSPYLIGAPVPSEQTFRQTGGTE